MTAENFTPEYVPPHLQGRVSDFRKERDGNVSFLDPRNALGTFGPEASRQTITPDVFRTTFGSGRHNLINAAKSQYGLPGKPQTLGTMAHDWVVGNARRGLDWGTSSQGKSVGTAGLLGALAGGTFGAVGEGGSLKKGLLYALLAGAAGSGLMAAGQGVNNRREANLAKQADFAETDLLSLLSQNFHISQQDKARYLAAIPRLSSFEKDELSRLLRVVGGAAAGATIMRYLRGKGLLGMVAGGMLGAAVGRATAPQQVFNNLGQLSVLNLRPQSYHR